MKIAFLFAGQGAQKVGMGLDFYTAYPASKALYDSIQLDFDVKEVCFRDPLTQLNDTAYTQSCLLSTSLAIAKAVESEGIVPSAVAGLSLGEYSALCYAQSLSLQSAVDLVRKRGLLMANALPKGSSSMTAILNGNTEEIKNLIQSSDVQALGRLEIANYNSPKQIVLSGEIAPLRAAEEKIKAANLGRVIPLSVSGAFHSSLLIEASLELEKLLVQVDFKQPQLPLYYNVSGQVEVFTPDLLKRQIASPVLFEKSLKAMIADGIDTFIEIGPGKALSGFVRQTDPNVKVFTVETVEQLIALKGELSL